MGVGLKAALEHVDPPPPADPHAPGPFAFSDPERVRGILEDAGFADVAIRPHDERIGGHTLEDALTVSRRVGPAALLMRENPDKREAIDASLRRLLAAEDKGGVWFDSATWIVTARKA